MRMTGWYWVKPKDTNHWLPLYWHYDDARPAVVGWYVVGNNAKPNFTNDDRFIVNEDPIQPPK